MRGPSGTKRSETRERITLLLPPFRAQQARQLAARRGIGVSTLIAEMVIKELDLFFGPVLPSVDGVDGVHEARGSNAKIIRTTPK